MHHALLLFGAGLAAGAMNAAVGGGSFVSLPAMVAAGMPPVVANASSTVALLPGTFASTYAYRRDVGGFEGVGLPKLLAVSVAGGLCGALLLLVTPTAGFRGLLPWLLLAGSLAFALGRPLGAWLGRRAGGPRRKIPLAAFLGAQFGLGIYGGYFGGAVGIMTMATWQVFGIADLKAANATRTLAVGAMNTVASICFVIAGIIVWPATLTMLAAAILGGYFGAVITRKLPATALRIAMTIFNFAMTAVFFYRAYG